MPGLGPILPLGDGMSGARKIPVFATVTNAYAFALGDFLTVLRLSLLPVLAIAVMTYVFMSDLFAVIPFPPAPLPKDAAPLIDPTQMFSVMRREAQWSLVMMVGSAMAIVPLMRAVLYGERQPGLLLYLRFGFEEVRVIVAAVVMQVAACIAIVPMMFVFIGLAAALQAGAQSPGGVAPVVAIVTIGLAVAMACLVLWLLLRLYMYPAVAVATNSLGLGESWTLMRGNVLRLFVVIVLTLVPFMLLALFATLAFAAEHLRAGWHPQSLDPAMFKDALPRVMAGTIFLQMLFGNAFIVGIVGNAYLALTQDSEGGETTA